MKYLIAVLIVMVGVSGAIKLQYDEYEEGEPCSGSWDYLSSAVWFDLDSLGFGSFTADSIEVGVKDCLPGAGTGFYIELWTGTIYPKTMLWTSPYVHIELPPPYGTALHLQTFPVDYDEPLIGITWLVIDGPGSNPVFRICMQSTGHDHTSFYDGGWTPSHTYDIALRLIGEDTSALTQSTWGAIKASY